MSKLNCIAFRMYLLALNEANSRSYEQIELLRGIKIQSLDQQYPTSAGPGLTMERTTHDACRLAQPGDSPTSIVPRRPGRKRKAYLTFLSELSVHARGFLRNRLQRQPSEIEDLLQEILLAMYSRRETYLPDQPATAWVFATARYKLARGGRVMMRFTTR